MSTIQYYLPIIARETKQILGLYNLGANITFTGAETKYTLGAGDVAIELWIPTPSLIRPVNQEFMASVWNHEDVRLKAYQGFAEFVKVDDALPSSWIGSSSGLANYVHQSNGAIIEGLSYSFGVGVANMVPINTVAPVVTGIETTGNLLTCDTGTWNVVPTSYVYQWYKNNVVISGEATNTYTLLIGDVGQDIRCVVWAVNAYGTSALKASNIVTPVA
jgi:hypothetical protein